jgi:hypothetical protein
MSSLAMWADLLCFKGVKANQLFLVASAMKRA